MAAWAVELLNETVEAELMALPKDMQARFLRISELLQNFGPQHVGMPHVRPLGEKMWEMRLTGAAGIGRAIYTAASGHRPRCTACIRKKDSEDSATCDRIGA